MQEQIVHVALRKLSANAQDILSHCATKFRTFFTTELPASMNSMKLVIPLHFFFMKKDSKRCCDTTTPESIHTNDESKRGSAFAFIFGVN